MAAPNDNVVLVGPLYSFELVVFFIGFTGIAIFNGVEMIITMFLSFRRTTSCYFLSLLAASIGIIIYQIHVFLMIYGQGLNIYGILTGIDVGWALMVVGQSMVLWSRLHLVCHNQKLLKGILYMIITTGLVCVITEVVLTMRAVEGNVLNSLNVPFIVCEKVTVAIFFAQELILSGVYVKETIRILRVGEAFAKRNSRRKLKELMVANLFIIALDVTLLCLEYSALWGIWCSFKGMAYSIKIKIEFSILNQLKNSLQAASTNNSSGPNNFSGRHYGRSNIEMDPYRSGNDGGVGGNHAVSNAYTSHSGRPVHGAANDHIMKTTEFTVTRVESPNHEWPHSTHEQKAAPIGMSRKTSKGSSTEIPLAAHAA